MDDNLILLPGVQAPASDAASTDDPAEPTTLAAEEAIASLEDAAPSEHLEKPAPHLVPAVVEALLLVTDRPLTVRQIDDLLQKPGTAVVTQALDDFQERLRRQAGGIRLVEVAKGWQLRTDVRAGPWVAAFRGAKPMRLSKAALETLAVVAYRQPVTRSEIEGLRGVDAGGVLRMLAEKGIVSASGRADEPGRPLYYTTTGQFLELFALRDLSDLPTLRDLRELKQDDPSEQLKEEMEKPHALQEAEPPEPDAQDAAEDVMALAEAVPGLLEEPPPAEEPAPAAEPPTADESPSPDGVRPESFDA